MTNIFAGLTFRDPDTNRINGISFELQLQQGTVTVSILEAPLSVELSQPQTFADALRDLGLALTEAAQNPERIHWHLQEKL